MTATGFIVEWLLRSSALILAGALLTWMFRVRNPSVRLAIWTVLLGGSFAIPLMHFALPDVPLPLIRETTQPRTAAPPIISMATEPLHESGIAQSILLPAPPPRAMTGPRDPAELFAIAYLLVAGFFLTRLFAGIVLSARVVGRSSATGIHTPEAEVRESNDVAAPVTAGVLRPVILLPTDWREWETAKLDAVLAHEDSHIRRRDPALQVLSVIHRAILWASPLPWFLHRGIVRIAEEISDDEAIARTHDPVSYAETLLDFMQREVRPPNWTGVAMARYERPGKRIRRILDSNAAPVIVTARGFAAIVAAGTVLAYFAAASQPKPRAPAIVPTPRQEIHDVAPIAQPSPRLLAQTEKPDQPATPPAKAQAPDTSGSVQPAFEVASVRPTVFSGPNPVYATAYTAGVLAAEARTPCLGGKPEISGDRVRITEVSICDLIRIAYDAKSFQVAGAPQAPAMTLAEARELGDKPIPVFFYDIEATAPEQQSLNDALVRTMLRSLLADRFGLVVHRETRDLPVYALIADKRGLKPETKPSPDCKPGPAGDFSQLCNQTMDKVVRNLSGSLDRPVVDMTGITESFQYRIPILRTDPDREADTRAAILDQLGLKLESRKGPMEVLVVDHVSAPSPN